MYQSGPIPGTGETVLTHAVTHPVFDGKTQYWWVVGNRKLLEGQPISYISGQYRSGWLYSDVNTLTTVEGPPLPRTTSDWQ